MRGTVEVSKTISQEEALAAGMGVENVSRLLEPGKILNLIVD